MWKASLFGMVFSFLLPLVSFGQTSGYQSASVELANLREDFRLLNQRVGELQLRLEQVEPENHDLRAKTAGASQTYATMQQLNEAVADLNRNIKSAAATSKEETVQQVNVRIEKLATQMTAALETLNKSIAASKAAAPPAGPISAPQFTDDYPK